MLGDSQPLTPRERVDGACTNKDFSRAIKDAGGSDRAYARAVRAETQELFDCGVDELYEGTGGKKGDRSSLPRDAQKAYMVSETLSTYRIRGEHMDSDQGSQSKRDAEIVESVRDTAEHVRKWLPW